MSEIEARLGFLVERSVDEGRTTAEATDGWGADGNVETAGNVEAVPTGEEPTAALAFARRVVGDVETVPLAAVAVGDVDLDRFDALWWHAYDPVSDPATVADCAGPIRTFLADGGGLFCSARALAQVSALGIDPVPPDATGTEEVSEPVGPLWHPLYAGHPAVDGLEGLRHHIRPAGSTAPYARYEDVLPERADVLASTYRGVEDVPREATVLQWRIGSGTVFGVGVGMEFAQHDDETTEATRERFTADVLRWLAGASEYDTALATGRPKSGRELARYRDALSGDRDRPAYHVTPPVNWLNDPNGLIHHDGTYHLFYQYNPAGPYHHSVHWGHAVSEDLVRWEDRPVAMSPDPSGPDRDGCWSGCAVAVDVLEGSDGETRRVVPAGGPDGGPDTPVEAADADAVYALYTGGRDGWQRPCLATATDADLTGFEADGANPVVRSPPPELDLLSTPGEPAHFRDHCLWYEADRWHQLIGAGLQDRGGAVVLYTSRDLREWTYDGPALVTAEAEPGVVWECPELLRFPDGDLLHVSDYEDVRYFLGTFDADDDRFRVDDEGTLDPGAFYAPQSLSTPDGRTVTVGWLREERSATSQWDAGWSGAMSLPREVAVVDGELRQRPAREVDRLRGTRLVNETRTVGPTSDRLDVTVEAFEVRARLDPGDVVVALRVRESPDGAERTTVRVGCDRIVVDRSESSLDRDARDAPVGVAVDDLERPLDVRVFVDASVLEVFVNGRRALATRIYPTRHDATGVSLSTVPSGTVTDPESPERVEVDLSVWRMAGAWPIGSDGLRRADPR
ncbi:sucrose-6-phosphate hydrolase [Halorubrum sp. 48-1-W]|uniref:GH32 C-terminal domain-containing protein n=1 Tax=Halorubrum sp. 48-1-W TaxID=2249761 RepID=UPI000DCD9C38|nr:GH32 C-terminal domain-containing protein [Halorubrum sp. 48-1-W]RAW45548.1 sucrose-6-phosphate hydrolase [Halorubrum sp. 48-1-W]